MKTVIDRSILTDHLLAALQPEDMEVRQWIVGDHEKPPRGGWQGEPGHSQWVPYLVLTATPSSSIGGGLGAPGSNVWFGYAVTVVGLTRGQAEKASAVARERLASLQRTKTGDGRTISQVQVVRYGGIDRLGAEPPLYLITDQFNLFTSA